MHRVALGGAQDRAARTGTSRGRLAVLLMAVAIATSASLLPGPQPSAAATPATRATSSTSPIEARPVTADWAAAVKAWLGPVGHWYRPVTVRLKPRPAAGAFSLNLFSPGDFVHQQTEYWCVAAAVQTMLNIIDDGAPDRSRRFQERLHFMGRRLDHEGDAYWRELAGKARWRQGLHGLGLNDWVGMLNAKGNGPYEPELERLQGPAGLHPGPLVSGRELHLGRLPAARLGSRGGCLGEGLPAL